MIPLLGNHYRQSGPRHHIDGEHLYPNESDKAYSDRIAKLNGVMILVTVGRVKPLNVFYNVNMPLHVEIDVVIVIEFVAFKAEFDWY